MPRKIISWFLSLTFIFQQTGFAQAAAVELNLASHLARMQSNLAAPAAFRPIHLRYLSYDPATNNFNLLLDKGDAFKETKGDGSVFSKPKPAQKTKPSPASSTSVITSPSPSVIASPDRGEAISLESETKQLLNYFLIGLTLPNDAFWVNLRPDSPDNVIDDQLARTDIGRILLEADLQLKKDTSLFTSPQTPEGKVYWDKLYKKAEELYGTDTITIPTLTRPWIVPGEIIVRETAGSPVSALTRSPVKETNPPSAYIYKATLKVMLEADYLKEKPQGAVIANPSASVIASPGRGEAIQKTGPSPFSDERAKALNDYSTQLIRELIIPKLTKEVNTSKKYASLRQVYYSLILSRWFKSRFASNSVITSPSASVIASPKGEAIPTFISLIDSQNLSNLTSKTSWDKDTYFQAYKKSFTEGEYNIKEPHYTPTGQVIRSYMSGGVAWNGMFNTGGARLNANSGIPIIEALQRAGLQSFQGSGSPIRPQLEADIVERQTDVAAIARQDIKGPIGMTPKDLNKLVYTTEKEQVHKKGVGSPLFSAKELSKIRAKLTEGLQVLVDKSEISKGVFELAEFQIGIILNPEYKPSREEINAYLEIFTASVDNLVNVLAEDSYRDATQGKIVSIFPQIVEKEAKDYFKNSQLSEEEQKELLIEVCDFIGTIFDRVLYDRSLYIKTLKSINPIFKAVAQSTKEASASPAGQKQAGSAVDSQPSLKNADSPLTEADVFNDEVKAGFKALLELVLTHITTAVEDGEKDLFEEQELRGYIGMILDDLVLRNLDRLEIREELLSRESLLVPIFNKSMLSFVSNNPDLSLEAIVSFIKEKNAEKLVDEIRQLNLNTQGQELLKMPESIESFDPYEYLRIAWEKEKSGSLAVETGIQDTRYKTQDDSAASPVISMQGTTSSLETECLNVKQLRLSEWRFNQLKTAINWMHATRPGDPKFYQLEDAIEIIDSKSYSEQDYTRAKSIIIKLVEDERGNNFLFDKVMTVIKDAEFVFQILAFYLDHRIVLPMRNPSAKTDYYEPLMRYVDEELYTRLAELLKNEIERAVGVKDLSLLGLPKLETTKRLDITVRALNKLNVEIGIPWIYVRQQNWIVGLFMNKFKFSSEVKGIIKVYGFLMYGDLSLPENSKKLGMDKAYAIVKNLLSEIRIEGDEKMLADAEKLLGQAVIDLKEHRERTKDTNHQESLDSLISGMEEIWQSVRGVSYTLHYAGLQSKAGAASPAGQEMQSGSAVQAGVEKIADNIYLPVVSQRLSQRIYELSPQDQRRIRESRELSRKEIMEASGKMYLSPEEELTAYFNAIKSVLGDVVMIKDGWKLALTSEESASSSVTNLTPENNLSGLSDIEKKKYRYYEQKKRIEFRKGGWYALSLYGGAVDREERAFLALQKAEKLEKLELSVEVTPEELLEYLSIKQRTRFRELEDKGVIKYVGYSLGLLDVDFILLKSGKFYAKGFGIESTLKEAEEIDSSTASKGVKVPKSEEKIRNNALQILQAIEKRTWVSDENQPDTKRVHCWIDRETGNIYKSQMDLSRSVIFSLTFQEKEGLRGSFKAKDIPHFLSDKVRNILSATIELLNSDIVTSPAGKEPRKSGSSAVGLEEIKTEIVELALQTFRSRGKKQKYQLGYAVSHIVSKQILNPLVEKIGKNNHFSGVISLLRNAKNKLDEFRKNNPDKSSANEKVVLEDLSGKLNSLMDKAKDLGGEAALEVSEENNPALSLALSLALEKLKGLRDFWEGLYKNPERNLKPSSNYVSNFIRATLKEADAIMNEEYGFIPDPEIEASGLLKNKISELIDRLSKENDEFVEFKSPEGYVKANQAAITMLEEAKNALTKIAASPAGQEQSSSAVEGKSKAVLVVAGEGGRWGDGIGCYPIGAYIRRGKDAIRESFAMLVEGATASEIKQYFLTYFPNFKERFSGNIHIVRDGGVWLLMTSNPFDPTKAYNDFSENTEVFINRMKEKEEGINPVIVLNTNSGQTVRLLPEAISDIREYGEKTFKRIPVKLDFAKAWTPTLKSLLAVIKTQKTEIYTKIIKGEIGLAHNGQFIFDPTFNLTLKEGDEIALVPAIMEIEKPNPNRVRPGIYVGDGTGLKEFLEGPSAYPDRLTDEQRELIDSIHAKGKVREILSRYLVDEDYSRGKAVSKIVELGYDTGLAEGWLDKVVTAASPAGREPQQTVKLAGDWLTPSRLLDEINNLRTIPYLQAKQSKQQVMDLAEAYLRDERGIDKKGRDRIFEYIYPYSEGAYTYEYRLAFKEDEIGALALASSAVTGPVDAKAGLGSDRDAVDKLARDIKIPMFSARLSYRAREEILLWQPSVRERFLQIYENELKRQNAPPPSLLPESAVRINAFVSALKILYEELGKNITFTTLTNGTVTVKASSALTERDIFNDFVSNGLKALLKLVLIHITGAVLEGEKGLLEEQELSIYVSNLIEDILAYDKGTREYIEASEPLFRDLWNEEMLRVLSQAPELCLNTIIMFLEEKGTKELVDKITDYNSGKDREEELEVEHFIVPSALDKHLRAAWEKHEGLENSIGPTSPAGQEPQGSAGSAVEVRQRIDTMAVDIGKELDAWAQWLSKLQYECSEVERQGNQDSLTKMLGEFSYLVYAFGGRLDNSVRVEYLRNFLVRDVIARMALGEERKKLETQEGGILKAFKPFSETIRKLPESKELLSAAKESLTEVERLAKEMQGQEQGGSAISVVTEEMIKSKLSGEAYSQVRGILSQVLAIAENLKKIAGEDDFYDFVQQLILEVISRSEGQSAGDAAKNLLLYLSVNIPNCIGRLERKVFDLSADLRVGSSEKLKLTEAYKSALNEMKKVNSVVQNMINFQPAGQGNVAAEEETIANTLLEAVQSFEKMPDIELETIKTLREIQQTVASWEIEGQDYESKSVIRDFVTSLQSEVLNALKDHTADYKGIQRQLILISNWLAGQIFSLKEEQIQNLQGRTALNGVTGWLAGLAREVAEKAGFAGSPAGQETASSSVVKVTKEKATLYRIIELDMVVKDYIDEILDDTSGYTPQKEFMALEKIVNAFDEMIRIMHFWRKAVLKDELADTNMLEGALGFDEIGELLQKKVKEINEQYILSFRDEFENKSFSGGCSKAFKRHVSGMSENIALEIASRIEGNIGLGVIRSRIKDIMRSMVSFSELLNLVHSLILETNRVVPDFAKVSQDNQISLRIKEALKKRWDELGYTVFKNTFIFVGPDATFIQVPGRGHAVSFIIAQMRQLGMLHVEYKIPNLYDAIYARKLKGLSYYNEATCFVRGMFDCEIENIGDTIVDFIKDIPTKEEWARDAFKKGSSPVNPGGINGLAQQDIMQRFRSPSIPDKGTGGIDFKGAAMASVTTYETFGSFAGLDYNLPEMSASAIAGFDLDKEELEITRLIDGTHILVSPRRIKEFMAASAAKGEFEERRGTVIAWLAKLGMLEEQQCCLEEASNEYKEAIVIAESYASTG